MAIDQFGVHPLSAITARKVRTDDGSVVAVVPEVLPADAVFIAACVNYVRSVLAEASEVS